MTTTALTSTFLDCPAGASQRSAELLAAHLRDCFRAQGRAFNLRMMGDSLHRLIAPRFCTTLVFVTGVLLLLSVVA